MKWLIMLLVFVELVQAVSLKKKFDHLKQPLFMVQSPVDRSFLVVEQAGKIIQITDHTRHTIIDWTQRVSSRGNEERRNHAMLSTWK